MSVLIGGGRGFVGRHLKKLLTEEGYKVTVVSRQTAKNQITWTDLERNGLSEDFTAVVNVAGENILNPVKRFSDQNYVSEIWKSRVDTTKLLAKAITEANKAPDVFVTMSGVGYYRPSPTNEYTESSEAGDDWIAKLAMDWESAGTLPENLSTRRVIIRSGVILGKDGGMIQMLRPLIKLAGGQKIGSGKQWLPWIHIEDMAGLITYAVKSDHVTGILNGVAPDTITNAEFTKSFASACNRPAFGFVPAFYMNMVFGPERAKVILEGQKVIPKRTLEVGYTFKYPTIVEASKELAL